MKNFYENFVENLLDKWFDVFLMKFYKLRLWYWNDLQNEIFFNFEYFWIFCFVWESITFCENCTRMGRECKIFTKISGPVPVPQISKKKSPGPGHVWNSKKSHFANHFNIRVSIYKISLKKHQIIYLINSEQNFNTNLS